MILVNSSLRNIINYEKIVFLSLIESRQNLSIKKFFNFINVII